MWILKSRIVRFCACARACVSVWGRWRWRGSSSGAHFRMFPAVLCDPSTSHHMMTEERLDGPRMPHSALSPLLLSLPSKAPFAPVRQDSVLLPFARYSHLLDLGAQSSDPFSTPSRSHGDGFKYHLLHANDFLKYWYRPSSSRFKYPTASFHTFTQHLRTNMTNPELCSSAPNPPWMQASPAHSKSQLLPASCPG